MNRSVKDKKHLSSDSDHFSLGKLLLLNFLVVLGAENQYNALRSTSSCPLKKKVRVIKGYQFCQTSAASTTLVERYKLEFRTS